MHDHAPRTSRRRWMKTAPLAILAVSVMAMEPRCTADDLDELLGPEFVSPAMVVGGWTVTYSLLDNTCRIDFTTPSPFTGHARVTTELVGPTHLLLWTVSDTPWDRRRATSDPQDPIRGPFDVQTGEFEGEQSRTQGLFLSGPGPFSESWSGVDIDVNGEARFTEGTSRLNIFDPDFGGIMCWLEFTISGERAP